MPDGRTRGALEPRPVVAKGAGELTAVAGGRPCQDAAPGAGRGARQVGSGWEAPSTPREGLCLLCARGHPQGPSRAPGRRGRRGQACWGPRGQERVPEAVGVKARAWARPAVWGRTGPLRAWAVGPDCAHRRQGSRVGLGVHRRRPGRTALLTPAVVPVSGRSGRPAGRPQGGWAGGLRARDARGWQEGSGAVRPRGQRRKAEGGAGCSAREPLGDTPRRAGGDLMAVRDGGSAGGRPHRSAPFAGLEGARVRCCLRGACSARPRRAACPKF